MLFITRNYRVNMGIFFVHKSSKFYIAFRSGSRIFFRRGCTRLLLCFTTNKPHSFFFFCRIPVVLENHRSSPGGGGGGAPGPPPPPLRLSQFFLEGKTSAPDFFSSCSFIPRANFESSSVVSCYGYEI